MWWICFKKHIFEAQHIYRTAAAKKTKKTNMILKHYKKTTAKNASILWNEIITNKKNKI